MNKIQKIKIEANTKKYPLLFLEQFDKSKLSLKEKNELQWAIYDLIKGA